MLSGTIGKLFAAVIVILVLVFAKPFVIVRAGTVGVIYSFGSIVGQVDEGVFTNVVSLRRYG